MMRIFVQIASYRDPELLPTLRDCIAKAAHPDRLRFGVAWQYAEGEQLDEFKDDPRFRILAIPYGMSQGVCWARRQTQELYQGEEFTLQLDSHHRFAENWDSICIDMLAQLQEQGYERPILSSYAPAYDPVRDPKGRGDRPMKIDFDSFLPSGTVFGRPSAMKHQSAPLPARFVSAHLLFTLGRFCTDVPYDPAYYFHGEELNLAVRAYTHGYDLFHPHLIVCWHEYLRTDKVKQWDDDQHWSLREKASQERNRALFGLEPSSKEGIPVPLGFGTIRTRHDYERYAGICFEERAVSMHTLEKKAPPDPDRLRPSEEWRQIFKRAVRHLIEVPNFARHAHESEFVAIIYEDESRTSLYRKDVPREKLKEMLDENGTFKVDSTVMLGHGDRVVHWIVWPHHPATGWGPKFEGRYCSSA